VRDLAFPPQHTGVHIAQTTVATSEYTNDIIMLAVTEITLSTQQQTVYLYWTHVNQDQCSFPITVVVLFAAAAVVFVVFVVGYFFCKFVRDRPQKFRRMK